MDRKLGMTTKYKEWSINKWQPKARLATHLLSRTTNFLLKNEVTPEVVDGIATNLKELQEALTDIQIEIGELERKKVL